MGEHIPQRKTEISWTCLLNVTVSLCQEDSASCKKYTSFLACWFSSRGRQYRGEPPDSSSPLQVSKSYRPCLWISQAPFSHELGHWSRDLWRRLFHRLCLVVRDLLLISSQNLFMASLYPFVLVPALSFSLKSFSPSLAFTPSDIFIGYNHIPSWPFFSSAKQPSASGLLWEHRLSIPLFGLTALLCSHCRPKSLSLGMLFWPHATVIWVTPHISKALYNLLCFHEWHWRCPLPRLPRSV